MTAENEDELGDHTRQRTSREEVRRRNREIMERANAELLEGKTGSTLTTPMSSGRKELSRFSLIKQSREGAQTFWTPYEFHTVTPEIPLGPIRVEMNVDQSKFTDFNRENMRPLFNECLKNTCLVDDVSIAYLDLINPEEVYVSTESWVDPLDEPLLTNDVSSKISESQSETVYTGHFLRKPQLMSNDLFTDGGRVIGNTSSRFSIPVGNSQIETDQFSSAIELDEKFSRGEPLFNPILKKELRAKRVLSVYPGKETGELYQFKLDEKSFKSNRLNIVMDRQFQSYEQKEDVTYDKKRKFVQTNKATSQNISEDYFILTIPSGADVKSCFLHPVSHKILLKKDLVAEQSEGSLLLHIVPIEK